MSKSYKLYLDVTGHSSLEMTDWFVAEAKLLLNFDREPVPPYTDRESKIIRRTAALAAPVGCVVGDFLYRGHEPVDRRLN